MAKIAKKKAAARAAFEGKSNLAVEDAVALVKANATAKFDETVEIAMNLGVDPRHADQMVRGVVTLPAGTGKTVRVGVFARGAKADEARAAGADVVGGAGDEVPRALDAGLAHPAQGTRDGAAGLRAPLGQCLAAVLLLAALTGIPVLALA